MSNSNRDDFSEKTKINAAKRTGYRCSICSISTIGPSSKSNSSTTSIGEAAHICAAAPGGKRYDPNMTPEERSSIDNCIWLCKIHARIIDIDDAKYPVVKLKELKQKAEKYAEAAISEVDVFRNQYHSSGDDISSLKNHFVQMINSGSYDLLRNILESYTNTISSVYDEFVLRFKLIYDMYCNHAMIDEHIKEYLELPNKIGADDLLEIAIPFNLEPIVRELLPFAVHNDIKKMAQLLIDGKLEDSLIGSKDSYEPFEISKEKQNLINNYVVHRAVARNIFRLQSVDGKDIELTSKESYYDLLFSAHRLVGKMVYSNASIKNTPKDSDFWELKKNVHIIAQLDACLQDFLWEAMLQFALDDKVAFCELIEQLPLHMQGMPRISKTHWLYRILCETSSVNIADLLYYSSQSNNYLLLSKYLWLISEESRYEFIKEHLYLCKENSHFLQIVCEYDKKHNLSTVKLSDYGAIFQNDFLYMCLKYEYSTEKQIKKETIEWLIKHQDLILIENLHLYLNILYKENKWDELINISSHCIHNEHLFHIANLLTKNDADTYNKKALRIYEELEQKGWTSEDLYFNIAVVSAKAGKVEKAKKYLKKEYDSYKSQMALFYLLQLRIETNEVEDDEYLYSAKNILTRDFQHIVAASYDKLMNHREARLYLLRTLLIDDNANCVGALLSLNIDDEEDHDEPEYIQNDCVCVLESETKKRNVAIHSEEVLNGLSPNNFANCVHFSVSDTSIASLMYHKKEEHVHFEEKEYKIIDIKSTSSFFASYALHQIVSHGNGVQTICASNTEEAITKITSCLMESKNKTDNILNEYNAAEIRYPISILASVLGKDSIETCEFLAMANSERIRNNQNVVTINDNNVYILSLDSIVNLAILNFKDVLLEKDKIRCPRQVKNRLLSEISQKVDDLNSKSKKGTIGLVDDRVRFMERTLEFKRDQHTFLSSIRKFVNSLPDVAAFDFESPHPNLESLFVERKMDVESGTLALLQNTPNSILVTDDQFLYTVAKMMGYDCIGLCGLLTNIHKDSIQLIEVSQKLKSINFANYIPLFLFDKIVECLSDEETKTDTVNDTDALTKWLVSDREGEEATDYHREVILQLYRDCVEQVGAPLSTEYPLTQIAIHHFACLHPEYVKQLLRNLSENIVFRIEGEQTDSTTLDS